MFNKTIPSKRLFFYASLIFFLPFLFLSYQFWNELLSLESLENELAYLEQEILIKEKKQAQNKAVQEHFKEADHFYIDKYLESITLLEPEIREIEKLLELPIPLSETVRKRYDFLTMGPNQIHFIEGQVKAYPTFQETLESLSHPVEADLNDLLKLLARIEGISLGGHEPPPNRPQLLIADFKLDKKETFQGRDIFLLNMKILKREFL